MAKVHDPRRPLLLAIRSMRLLAFIFLLFGGLAFAFGVAGPGGIILAGTSLVMLLPGIAYAIVSYALKKLRTWAITAGLVVASLHGVMALIVLFAQTVTFLRGGMVHPVALVLGLLWVLALAQLIYHLSKSYEAMIVMQGETQRGFEPIMPPAPVQPVPVVPVEQPRDESAR